MQFGYLGVGALSTPMIRNFLSDGHSIKIWNRTRSRAEAIEHDAATVVDEAAGAAEPGGVVVSCLSNDAALSAVFDDGSVFESLGEGGVHVSMSTCSPQMTTHLSEKIAEHGGIHLTCPVLGRPDFVERRAQRFCISGDESAYERFKPVLEPASSQLFYLGDKVQAASVAKICSNFLIASAVESISESLALAVGSGVDADAIRQMWNQTYFPGVIYEEYSKQILGEQFDPLFALNLMAKDIGLFAAAADRQGIDVPVADQISHRYRSAMHQGLAEKDFIAVSKLAFDQARG